MLCNYLGSDARAFIHSLALAAMHLMSTSITVSATEHACVCGALRLLYELCIVLSPIAWLLDNGYHPTRSCASDGATANRGDNL